MGRSGPLNTGTFGPNQIDDTFGPEVRFLGIPAGMAPNRSPKDGLQFFGTIKIEGKTEIMTVGLHDIAGRKIFSIDLTPQHEQRW